SQVDTNNLLGGSNIGSRNGYNDMEVVTPVMIAEISRTDLFANILESVFGNGKAHHNASLDSCKRSLHALPLDPIRAGIIADRSGFRLRTTNRLEGGRFFSLFLGFFNQLGIASCMLLLPCE